VALFGYDPPFICGAKPTRMIPGDEIMKAKRALIAFHVLMVAALACNMPGGSPPATPTAAVPPTETATPAPLATATITVTASPTVPLVSVSQSTNCRNGPSTAFDIVFVLNPGTKAEVVGKNTALNYWIIKVPGGSGQCWLWGQYATVEGNIAALPEFSSPPTPTPSVPAAVKNLTGDTSCQVAGNPILYNEVHVELHWTDVANNEEGYRIFRNGELLATLAANSTSFEDDTTLVLFFVIGQPPPSVTYDVQAFNSAGKSDKKSITLDCS
jgi:hypothetical protein